MLVELIPVIEITRFETEVPLPKNSGKDPQVWDEYYAASFIQAGIPDKLVPYTTGSWFYRLRDISDANLKKLVIDQTEETREEDYLWEEGYGRPFYGGYVLRVDGEDKYFPQCCTDLSDLSSWKALLTDPPGHFYTGHPSPTVKVEDGIITFDFTAPEPNEPFSHGVPDEKVSFSIELLRQALANINDELNEFAARLISINESEKLGIPNIDNFLIWNGKLL